MVAVEGREGAELARLSVDDWWRAAEVPEVTHRLLMDAGTIHKTMNRKRD